MLLKALMVMRGFVDVVLRVPPLFAMDTLLKSPYSVTMDLTATLAFALNAIINVFRTRKFEFVQISLAHAGILSLHLLGFMICVLLFLLPTRQLLSVYVTVASSSVIVWSYLMNKEYVKYCVNLVHLGTSLHTELFSFNAVALQMFFGNYSVQAFWSFVFCFSKVGVPDFSPWKMLVGISFIFPTLISLAPLPEYIFSNIPYLTLATEVSLLLCCAIRYRKTLRRVVMQTVRYFSVLLDSYGAIHFAIHHWKRMNISRAMELFFLARTAKRMAELLYDATYLELLANGTSSRDIAVFVLKDLLSHSCDTFLAVVSFTVILTILLASFVKWVQRSLLLPPIARRDLVPSIAILFVALAMQIGLTSLEPSDRLIRVYRNLILVIAAVAHSIREEVHTSLISLGTSGNTSLRRHFRVIFWGALLVLYTGGLFTFLLMNHSSSAWLFAATTFCVEVLINCLVSFLMYILNIIDTHRSVMWENFDDYIFYLTTTEHFTNFVFNMLLLLNACYILVYESFGVTRIVLMSVHAYFNMWMQVQSGWRLYRRRQYADRLIKSLREATVEQLRIFDDVCSICHQTLNSARITACNHFFHGVCLKKCLYEQNNCPFCQKPLLSNSVPTEAARLREHDE